MASANRPNINRPNMGSLPTPSTRPSGGLTVRPNTGNRPGNIANFPGNRPGGDFRFDGGRPSAGELDKFLDLPGSGGGGIARPGNIAASGAAAQFLHEHPTPFPSRPGADDIASNLPATRPGQGGGGEQIRPGDRPNRPGQGGSGEQWRPSDWANHRPDRISDRKQWSNWRNDHRNDIINDWHDHWHDYGHWFDHDWWNRPGWNYPYTPNYNYWAWAAWPGVSSWVDYGWSQPVAYNYGDNVYYQGDQVYYGDQPVATAPQYAEQAEAIATNVPATKPAPEDWMPLGVFAISADGKPSGADPTMFLQLAVSKQGMINGTFQNTATDDVKQIQGMVDKETQRAAWTPVGKDRPVMETGIVNLTHDTTPALVHFADGSTQQWLLVRLDKPKEGEATQTK
jgi:hypothetical protein